MVANFGGNSENDFLIINNVPRTLFTSRCSSPTLMSASCSLWQRLYIERAEAVFSPEGSHFSSGDGDHGLIAVFSFKKKTVVGGGAGGGRNVRDY